MKIAVLLTCCVLCLAVSCRKSEPEQTQRTAAKDIAVSEAKSYPPEYLRVSGTWVLNQLERDDNSIDLDNSSLTLRLGKDGEFELRRVSSVLEYLQDYDGNPMGTELSETECSVKGNYILAGNRILFRFSSTLDAGEHLLVGNWLGYDDRRKQGALSWVLSDGVLALSGRQRKSQQSLQFKRHESMDTPQQQETEMSTLRINPTRHPR